MLDLNPGLQLQSGPRLNIRVIQRMVNRLMSSSYIVLTYVLLHCLKSFTLDLPNEHLVPVMIQLIFCNKFFQNDLESPFWNSLFTLPLDNRNCSSSASTVTRLQAG
jgi:hypothetical protein